MRRSKNIKSSLTICQLSALPSLATISCTLRLSCEYNTISFILRDVRSESASLRLLPSSWIPKKRKQQNRRSKIYEFAKLFRNVDSMTRNKRHVRAIAPDGHKTFAPLIATKLRASRRVAPYRPRFSVPFGSDGARRCERGSDDEARLEALFLFGQAPRQFLPGSFRTVAPFFNPHSNHPRLSAWPQRRPPPLSCASTIVTSRLRSYRHDRPPPLH